MVIYSNIVIYIVIHAFLSAADISNMVISWGIFYGIQMDYSGVMTKAMAIGHVLPYLPMLRGALLGITMEHDEITMNSRGLFVE